MRHAGCLKGITKHQNSMAFIRNDIATGDMFRHVYGGMTKRELDDRAAQLLSAWGYKRVADKGSGSMIYEKGNRVARLLLGALVRYFKVSVTTSVSPSDEVICEVRTESSGMSGGLIGMNQVKTEMGNLNAAFRDF